MKAIYKKDKFILHDICKYNEQYEFHYSKGYSDKYGFHYYDNTGNIVHIKNKNKHNIFNSKEAMEKAGILAYTFRNTYHDLRYKAFCLEFKYENDTLVDLNFEEGFISKRGIIFNVTSMWHDSERFVVRKIDITNKEYYKVFNDESEAVKFVKEHYGENAAHYLYKRICDRLEGFLCYCDNEAKRWQN